MKCLCLANPRASSWERSEEALKRFVGQRDIPLVPVHEEADWLKRIRDEPEQRVLLCGGDGTLSRLVNTLAREQLLPSVEVAVVPMGTGNDFARSIGLIHQPLTRQLELAVEQRATAVDLIRVVNGGEQLIVNAATGGFGGLISSDVTGNAKQQWGAMAYWATAFTRLTSMQQYQVKVELDDQCLSLAVFGLAISSGGYVGGGFPVAPQAIVNDGKLDVTVVPEMPMVEALAAGVEFSLGRHEADGLIPCFRSKNVHVTAAPIMPYSLDGEGTRSFDARFEVVPGALRIVTADEAESVQRRHAESQEPKSQEPKSQGPKSQGQREVIT